MPGYTKAMSSLKTSSKPKISDVLKTEYQLFYNLLLKYKLVKILERADNLTVFALTDEALLNQDILTKDYVLDHILQYSKSPPPNYRKMKTFKTLTSSTVSATAYKKFIKKIRMTDTMQGKIYKTDKILSPTHKYFSGSVIHPLLI